jgi:hypothetical protein
MSRGVSVSACNPSDKRWEYRSQRSRAVPEQMYGIPLTFPLGTSTSRSYVPYIRMKTAIGLPRLPYGSFSTTTDVYGSMKNSHADHENNALDF